MGKPVGALHASRLQEFRNRYRSWSDGGIPAFMCVGRPSASHVEFVVCTLDVRDVLKASICTHCPAVITPPAVASRNCLFDCVVDFAWPSSVVLSLLG